MSKDKKTGGHILDLDLKN
ncbi:hypothetical protein IKN40_02335 [bacterium]|nr:hypothetical protein [bacterium]